MLKGTRTPDGRNYRMCEALHITKDEYDAIYAEIEQKMASQSIVGVSLRTKAAREHMRHLLRHVLGRFEDAFSRIPQDKQLDAVTQFARRCNHNTQRRALAKSTARTKGGQSTAGHQCEPPTTKGETSQLKSNDLLLFPTIFIYSITGTGSLLVRTKQIRKPGYHNPTTDVDELSFDLFISILKQDIGFQHGVDGIYYYMIRTSGWTRIPVISESIWQGAIEDTLASGSKRPEFVIEPVLSSSNGTADKV